jgi:hypothetical protein
METKLSNFFENIEINFYLIPKELIGNSITFESFLKLLLDNFEYFCNIGIFEYDEISKNNIIKALNNIENYNLIFNKFNNITNKRMFYDYYENLDLNKNNLTFIGDDSNIEEESKSLDELMEIAFDSYELNQYISRKRFIEFVQNIVEIIEPNISSFESFDDKHDYIDEIIQSKINLIKVKGKSELINIILDLLMEYYSVLMYEND